VRPIVATAAALFVLGQPVSGQWPMGQGNFWAKTSFFYHETAEQYRSNGDRLPFLNSDAKSVSKAFFVDASVGLFDGLDVWLQVPYFDLTFNDDADDRRSTGVGDIRLSARYNLFQLKGGSLPISARFTTKFPVNDFPINAEVIPVGEGQFDYELWLESGLSLWPLPAYTVVWVGYRWRTLNTETTRKPGNEFTFLAEFGGTALLGGLGGKIVVDGLFGEPGEIQGIAVGDADRRQILYVGPTLLYSFTESTMLEVGARIPLLGKNWPAGAPFQVGLFHTGSLWN
jgi:outer membrane putative beta-barrel porin/alpha-amylase